MSSRGNPRLRAAIRLAAGVPLFATGPAFGSEGSAAPRLEEVVVTATRRDASVQDIPYNLSAVTGEQLERFGITDIGTLMRNVPGVAFVDSGPRGAGMNNAIIIRGINANSQTGATLSPLGSVAPVSTYIGDTPLFTDLYLKDIERVEVLRGPQGTLYGSGSLGGTVRFLFNKPEFDQLSVLVDGQVSSIKDSGETGWETNAVANIPLGEAMAVRVNAGKVSRAGFIDAVGLHQLGPDGIPALADPSDVANSPPVIIEKSDVDDSETTYARVTLGMLFGERVSADLIYHHQGDEASATQGQSPYTDELENTLRNLEPYERDVDLGALEIEADFGFATLASSTSYFENESEGLRDATGGYVGAGFWAFYEGSPRENILGRVTTREDKFVQELRLTSNQGEAFDWIVGAYYADEELNLESVDTLLGWSAWHEACSFCAMGYPTANHPSDLNYTFDRTFEVSDLAAFGELTYHITDRWQVTGGFRAFRIEVDNVLDQTLPMCGSFCSTDGIDPAGRSGGTLSRTFNDQIFRFNTSYDLTERHLVYLNLAEGFRRGGANAVPTTGVFAEDPLFLSYDPDLTTNYEVGLKGQFLERFRYSGSLYYIDWDDIQIDTGTPNGGFPAIVNGDTARSQGVELELQGSITDDLVVSASYTYVDAELTSDFTAGAIEGFDGDQLPLTPQHMASMSVEYFMRPALFNGMELGFHLTGFYRGEASTALNAASPDYADLDGFSIWDASASLRGEHLTVRLFVDNVGDSRGITGLRTADRVTTQGAFALVTQPRTAGLAISYRFE